MARKKSPKKFGDRRTANPPGQDARTTAAANEGQSPQQLDPKRRLGNFQTAGEHARTGTRNK